MEEKINLPDLLLRAWKISWMSPLLWVLGAISAGTSVLENFWLDKNTVSSGADLFRIFSSYGFKDALLLALVFGLVFLVSVFGKSNLVVQVFERIKSDSSRFSKQHSLPHYSPFLLFWRGLQVEFLSAIAFIVLIVILASPVFLSSFYSPEKASLLFVLGSVTFIPLTLSLFCVKEFTLCYSLLTSLSLRQALENGTRLFSLFPLPAILLGAFTFFGVLLFTICINLVMLGALVLFENIGFSLGNFFLGFLALTWLSLFQRALWTLFFIEIAGPKAPDQEKESVPLIEKRIPEVPAA